MHVDDMYTFYKQYKYRFNCNVNSKYDPKGLTDNRVELQSFASLGMIWNECGSEM